MCRSVEFLGYVLRSTYDTYHTLVTLLPVPSRFCPVACTFPSCRHPSLLWHTKTFFFHCHEELELRILLITSRKTAFLVLTSHRLVNETDAKLTSLSFLQLIYAIQKTETHTICPTGPVINRPTYIVNHMRLFHGTLDSSSPSLFA